MSFNRIIESLFNQQIAGCFNPYNSYCEEHDLSKSITIRQENLRNMMKFYVQISPSTLMVGESLGYLGGKRTGLPFTDEFTIGYWNNLLDKNKMKIASKKPYSRELTAGSVWRFLSKLETSIFPFLWNVLPFHPFKAAEIHSNRGLNTEDLKLGKSYLLTIMDKFSFDTILAVGKRAQAIIEKFGYNCTYVRHPSHGGNKIFLEQVNGHFMT